MHHTHQDRSIRRTRPTLIQAVGACVMFLALVGLFGFGGCMLMAGWGKGMGLTLGWIWFGLVSVGTMWLVLAGFGIRAEPPQDEQP